jgi:HD-GYP domain-containing protein (c-di-GMP phosphodiesterase class II)
MQLAPLASVKHRVQLGRPLPFNVRDADRTLLLARGWSVESHEQLEALFTRGALVDLAELHQVSDEVVKCPREQLPRLWQRCMVQASQTLLNARPGQSFAGAVEEAAAPLQLLVERDPDLAIFQVLRTGAGVDVAYGAARSLQTAITALLVAQRLAWEPAQCERAFKVALTMNISMLELQGQLARQRSALSAAQRAELASHPMRSVQLLQLAGIEDADWLGAVLRHHEHEDGSGYPSGCSDVGELASLARRADTYTAKLASRSTRAALAADIAGRQMFMQDPGHPMTAALVKEFGIYPPGCMVRLASGELAIVVQRGARITTPVVACLTDAAGRALAQPERRDTARPGNAVAAVVGEGTVRHAPGLDRLAAVLAG